MWRHSFLNCQWSELNSETHLTRKWSTGKTIWRSISRDAGWAAECGRWKWTSASVLYREKQFSKRFHLERAQQVHRGATQCMHRCNNDWRKRAWRVRWWRRVERLWPIQLHQNNCSVYAGPAMHRPSRPPPLGHGCRRQRARLLHRSQQAPGAAVNPLPPTGG